MRLVKRCVARIRSHQDINVPNHEDIEWRYIVFVHPIPLHGRPLVTEEPFKPVHGSDQIDHPSLLSVGQNRFQVIGGLGMGFLDGLAEGVEYIHPYQVTDDATLVGVGETRIDGIADLENVRGG
jgi:hypothetical protein